MNGNLTIRVCAALLLSAVFAWSCPVCNTDTGEAVRRGIFNSNFGQNLLVTVAPFAVFYAIAAAVHFRFPGGRR